MKLVEGLSYRQWQQRNTSRFKLLAKDVQQEIRAKGYHNVGWKKVEKSWNLISQSKPVNLINYKIKSGDIDGAIDIVNIESEKAKKLTNKTLDNIQKTRQQLNKLVADNINNYSKV